MNQASIDTMDHSTFHELVRMVAMLQKVGMPLNFIKNQAVLDEVKSIKRAEPYDFNTWHNRL